MTVIELIEKLKTYPPDGNIELCVYTSGSTCGYPAAYGSIPDIDPDDTWARDISQNPNSNCVRIHSLLHHKLDGYNDNLESVYKNPKVIWVKENP